MYVCAVSGVKFYTELTLQDRLGQSDWPRVTGDELGVFGLDLNQDGPVGKD